ncbi:MAG TPA: M18 family aminopeptidase [Spirochaetia bacterium]|nr:M18 family aminopeptidase [Spirochaetia bacterium]
MNGALVKRLVDFLDASPSAYHAVDSMAAALEARGARRLGEREAWELEPGAPYYVVRGGSALVAFRPGLRPPQEGGFALAGAHTDSPALKARIEKPLSGKGMERVPVEVYGGAILSSWLDRPLGLAGRAVLRGSSGGLETRLVNLARAVGVVPDLAIHLNREVNKGFEYNAQNHLPVLAAALPAAGEGAPGGPAPGAAGPAASWLLSLVARELGVEASSVLGSDLYFVDVQRAALFGPASELLNSARLDDLVGCHAVLEAFLDAGPAGHGQVACFLDNEEVGSRTAQGADSSFLRDLLGRICALAGCGTQDFYRALASSFCVSVDVAQAFHPSYADKYDEAYAPLLNGGPALKANANFRYATDGESEARFRLLCAEAGVPCQKFMSRADIAPGTTIGPLGSSLTGVPTVDVGAPLLSMHAMRETVGARDHEAMVRALGALYRAGPRPGGREGPAGEAR